MAERVVIPTFQSKHSAVLADWLIAEGDAVNAGDVICQVTIDKVTLDVVSPTEGVVRTLLAEVNQCIPSGGAVAVVGGADEELDTALLDPGYPTQMQESCPLPMRVEEAYEYEIDNRAGGPRPLSAMEDVVARRMSASKQNVPHFYLTTTINMTAATAMRKELKREGRPVSFNDMILKACALGLRQYPRMMAAYSTAGIVERTDVHVGFACAIGDEGLVVPVVRNADSKSLFDIAQQTKALIKKVNARTLTPDDYAAGVFSVSNLGLFDIHTFNAIINPGEAAIFAVGKIYDAPWVEKKELVVAPLLHATISSDHRVVNGVLAARFNGFVKSVLEKPERLLEA